MLLTLQGGCQDSWGSEGGLPQAWNREGGMPSLSPQASQLRDPAAPWLWGLGKHFTCLRQSSPVRGAVCWPRLGQLSEGRRLGAVRRAWG